MKIIPVTQNLSGFHNSGKPYRHEFLAVDNESRVVDLPNFYYRPSMKGNVAVYKPYLPKVTTNRNALLKKLQGILKTKPKDLDNVDVEFVVEYCKEKVYSIIESLEDKLTLLYEEMKSVNESTSLSSKQKASFLIGAKAEFEELDRKYRKYIENIRSEIKKRALEEIYGTTQADENYDYELINKFKCAIQDNNFDLDKVFMEHYAPLENMQTAEEIAKQFPTIKIPQNPVDIVAKKYTDVLTRDFYLAMNEFIDRGDITGVGKFIYQKFMEISKAADTKYKNTEYLQTQELLDTFTKTATLVYKKLKRENKYSTIPTVRNTIIPALTQQDIDLLSIDYDFYVTTVIKAIYLRGIKPSHITYQENNRTINISDIKVPEYKFEKLSERVKKFISIAKEIKEGYRAYDKFSVEDFNERLNYYSTSEIANNDRILETILEFQESNLTDVDILHLKKLLAEFDSIQDGKKTVSEVAKIIEKEAILPQERKILNEKELEEQRKKQAIALKIKQINARLENAVNTLYSNRLNSLAQICEKYSIETLDKDKIEIIDIIAEVVEKNINKGGENTFIKNSVLNLETYVSALENNAKSADFAKAVQYGTVNGKLDKIKAGQYLRNLQKLFGKEYDSTENKDELIELIKNIDQVSNEEKIITLCKYEDFISSQKENECSILDALDLFDKKSVIGRSILKYIVETNYVNKPTTIIIKNATREDANKAVIAPEAKQQILDKYKSTGCIDIYEAFEEAASQYARNAGSAGIKMLPSYNKKLQYEMELKIYKGRTTNRLFSSNNDYVFDIFDAEGLH